MSGCNQNIEAGTYFNVSFDSNGGSECESIRVKEGERIPKPSSPSIKYGTFSYWSIQNGNVKIDDNVKYIDGEQENWSETYLGDDRGPYLIYSDCSFKANYTMENKTIRLEECFGHGREKLKSLYSIDDKFINCFPKNDYYTGINWSFNGGDAYSFIHNHYMDGNVDLIGYRYVVPLSESIPESAKPRLEEKNNHELQTLAYEIKDQEYVNFVNQNFNDIQKQFAFRDNKLLGIPLYEESIDLTYWEEDTAYSLACKSYTFISMANNCNWNTHSDKHQVCLEFMKNFSLSFLSA